MRIALFHNVPSGGAKRAIYEWTKRLCQDHTIDVYTLSSADHAFLDIRPFAEKHIEFPFNPRRLFPSPFGRLNQFQRWLDLGDLDRQGREIAEQINQGNYDLAFVHCCIIAHTPPLLKYLEIPSCFFLHEIFGSKVQRSFQRPYFKANPIRVGLDQIDPLIKLYQYRLDQLQRGSLAHAGMLVAGSEFIRQTIKQHFSVDSVPGHYYGVTVQGFYREPLDKKGFVLSVGEMTPRKGFDFLIDSLGLIPADRRPKLVIASNRKVSQQEVDFIEQRAVDQQVELEILWNQNTDQLRLLYNQAELCVYSPVLEPFGLVPLEAMACGTPVVGVREGGVADSVLDKKTGLLVERDPAQFAQAVISLLNSPQTRDLYGHQGIAYVKENWTWEASTARLDALFQEAVQKQSRI